MVEITRLKNRLKNASTGTTEYRMTIKEARNLVAEIDSLIAECNKKPTVIEKEVYIEKEVEVVKQPYEAKFIDGGTF